MKIKTGYATYRIYEILTATVAGEKQDVVGGLLEEVVGKDAAETRLSAIRESGKRAEMKYLCGVEDPTAIGRRNW
jgi:hypothetical protein